ncbi:MAG: glycoside hydrolase family 5 protein [Firmicutes bacterium]|nr:glycoside hydrolase family 5 protein [Bacillota bacterium]
MTKTLRIGEFGGCQSDLETREGIWQNALVDYVKANRLSFAYWTLTPDSDDTGGLLEGGWKTVDEGKTEMLKRVITGKGENRVLAEEQCKVF